MSYAVADPQIDEVMDLDTGQFFDANVVIGSDYGRLMQLRMALRSDIARGEPRYGCGECQIPVYLVRRAEKEHFFFRHLLEDGRCHKLTRGEESERQILARKYDGAKESRLHQRLKAYIARSLAADPAFSDIRTEATWVSTKTGRRRKPDVRARFGDLPVAFEVQLSTTFIRVIAERREFYLSESGLLFWVFARFSEENRRLTEDDVFYNNNRNAFVVSEETMDTSIQAGQFCLDCYWSEPSSSGPLQHKRVAFGELTLDRPNQRAFYFDYDGTRAAEQGRRRQALLAVDAPLRRQFEGFWFLFIQTGTYDRGAWLQLQRAMIRRGISLPAYPKEVSRPLLSSLYSARAGKSVGFEFRTFIEVAHRIASGYPGFLRTFRRALDVYDRADQLIHEDHTGKWRKKVALYKEKLAANDPAYDNGDPHPELTAFLFPELA